MAKTEQVTIQQYKQKTGDKKTRQAISTALREGRISSLINVHAAAQIGKNWILTIYKQAQ